MRFFCLLSVVALLVCINGCQKAEQSKSADATRRPNTGSSAPVTIPEDDPAVIETPSIRFVDVTASCGIEFSHVSGDSEEKPFPAANGSGLAAFDYDLDGWIDLYFLNGTTFPIDPDQQNTTDAFYRNRSAWSFTDVTVLAGLGQPGYSAGAVAGDFNSDGFPDVFVNCFGDNRFYINQGDGTFEESAKSFGVEDPSWGTSAAALDFDNDGDLDLYACNYAEWTWESNAFCGNREKNIRIFCSPRSVKPVADRLFENLGDGRFQDVLAATGLARDPARGQGVVAADIDFDGRSDLYVGNDLNTNSLFRNKGDGTFEDLTDVSGTAVDFAGQIQAGMGVDVADVDRDGLVEIFVSNYEGEHNAFYKNLGNNTFQEVSQSKGLAAPSMKWVGWGSRFADFDLDGWQDLVITNGHTDNNLHLMGRDAVYEQPPLLFRNQTGRLTPVVSPRESYFGKRHPGRALCVADLDCDLAPDIVFGHKDAAPAVLRNASDRNEESTTVVLSFCGVQSNRDGIGVRVEVEGQLPILRAQIKSGGSYLSSDPCQLTISLTSREAATLKIIWPGGTIEHVALPTVAGRYTVIEGRQELMTHNL